MLSLRAWPSWCPSLAVDLDGGVPGWCGGGAPPPHTHGTVRMMICGREHRVSIFLLLFCIVFWVVVDSWVEACCRDVCVLVCEHRVVGFSCCCCFSCCLH